MPPAKVVFSCLKKEGISLFFNTLLLLHNKNQSVEWQEIFLLFQDMYFRHYVRFRQSKYSCNFREQLRLVAIFPFGYLLCLFCEIRTKLFSYFLIYDIIKT